MPFAVAKEKCIGDCRLIVNALSIKTSYRLGRDGELHSVFGSVFRFPLLMLM